MHTTTQDISVFMGGDRSSMICFRCGQTGHVRYQCLQYKVRMCMHYMNGGCNDHACTFAHGPHELRTPWKIRCVRVVKKGGTLVCIGCNSTDHTFRRCPYKPAVSEWEDVDEEDAECIMATGDD